MAKKASILLLVFSLILSLAGCIGCGGDGDNGDNGDNGTHSDYDVELSAGQQATVEYTEMGSSRSLNPPVSTEWLFTLEGGGWNLGNVTVEMTIENIGTEIAHLATRESGAGQGGNYLKLFAIDYYGAITEPEGGDYAWPYVGPYYPGQSRSVELNFSINPYCGETGLYCMHDEYSSNRWFIFDLGSPAGED